MTAASFTTAKKLEAWNKANISIADFADSTYLRSDSRLKGHFKPVPHYSGFQRTRTQQVHRAPCAHGWDIGKGGCWECIVKRVRHGKLQ